jgi:peptidoglycan-associated lipoprotein
MKSYQRLGVLLALATIVMTTTGCRYFSNRYYDLRDTFGVGAGFTHENPVTGPIPPSLGLFVNVTEWFNLGWLSYNGYSAEMDQRGTFVGPEYRFRGGLFWWQVLKLNQDYDYAVYRNVFKDRDFLWTQRMRSLDMRYKGHPAKRLNYEHWAHFKQQGTGLYARGYQYWAHSGVEVAISEPFITHFGFTARLGVDISEVSDFVLGWLAIDFKGDDLNEDEWTARWEGAPTEEIGEQIEEVEELETAAPMEEVTAIPPPESHQPDGPRPGDLLPFPEMRVIYFNYDRHGLRADQMERVDQNLRYLLDHPDQHVLVEGHCDERGTQEYNFNLGLRRANAVRDYFISNGVDAGRVQVVSKGEETPVDPGHTDEAWDKNRRAEFQRVVVIRPIN